MSLATLEAELDRRIASLRKEWGAPSAEPIPLSRAYELLGDDVIKNAWIDKTAQLVGHAPAEVSIFGGRFSPRIDGHLCVPSFDDVKKPLQPVIAGEIQAGIIILQGIQAGSELRGKPVKVAPDRLQLMRVDHEECSASIDGKVVLRSLTVLREGTPSAKRTSKIPPIHEFHEFMTEHIAAYKANGKIPREEDTLAEARKRFPGIPRAFVRQKREVYLGKLDRGPRGPRMK